MIAQGQYTIVTLYDGSSLYTWVKYADDASGTNMSDSPTGKIYMGVAYNKTSSTESTTATDYSWSLIQGPQGTQGPTGGTGATGKGISSIVSHYLATSSSSGVTTSTTGWTTTVQTMTTTNTYLWSYQTITYTDSTTTDTSPVIIGAYGNTGSTGKGISSVTEYYLATSASTGVTTSTTGWTTTTQTMTATNKYLWNYEKITYTDNSITTIGPSIKGVYGDKGNDGTTTYTWVKYADDIYGGNMSDSATGKRYVGMAFNKTTSTESTIAGDYSWSPLYENVSVGGRNLLPNTDIKNSGLGDFISNGSPISLDATLLYLGNKTIKIDMSTSTGGMNDSSYITLKKNTVYTYSMMMYSPTSISIVNGNPLHMWLSDTTSFSPNVHLETIQGHTPSTLPANTWTKVSTTFLTPSTNDVYYWKPFIYGGFPIGSIVNVWGIMCEESNIATDWSPAPEDIQAQIDYKAATSDMDALATIVSSVSADLNNKAGSGEFQSLQDAFDARVTQDIADKAALSASLSTLDGRTTLVETIANNSKIVTDFINTVITESDEGIYIANGSSSTGILIASDRISFMSNNIEVAYISNQTMQINHGIFVQSATIANFKFEAIPGTTILAVQWVGG